MTDFFQWLSSGSTSAIIFITLIGISVFGIILIYLTAFIQGREVSFWPPKIGEKPILKKQLPVTPLTGLDKSEVLLPSSTTEKLGLENIYRTRGLALAEFSRFLDEEIQRADKGDKNARVWIVSSSMKGFITSASEQFDGHDMMKRIAHSKCDLRIMMTDPEFANLRAQQEGRYEGEIPLEAKMFIASLKRLGVKRGSIKYYRGTPTVFAIVTSDKMLLNPYPYEIQAFRCFSLVLKKTTDPSADIFHQYLCYHFELPWEKAKQISADEWTDL